jgi:hypothetical protein
MRNSWRPALAFLFAWGSVVGLIRLAAVYFANVAAWWADYSRWLAAGAIPFAFAWWWFSRQHDAAERRRMSAPRTIPLQRRGEVGVGLVHSEPQDLLLVHHAADREAAEFSTDLMIALHNSAGWTAHQRAVEGDHGVTGLRVTVSAQASPKQKASAKALRRTLRNMGFKVDTLRTMPEHVEVGFLNLGRRSVAIMLTIGTR